MKFRCDFVTNSSSSSFIACGVYSEELAAFLDDEFLYGTGFEYGSTKQGVLVLKGNVLSMTTRLDYGDFHIHRLLADEVAGLTQEEEDEDNRRANTAEHILTSLLVYFPDFTEEQRKQVEALVEAAVAAGRTQAVVYLDFTDELDAHEFRPEDFGENG